MPWYVWPMLWPVVSLVLAVRLGFLHGYLTREEWRARFYTSPNLRGETKFDDGAVISLMVWPLCVIFLPRHLGGYLRSRRDRVKLPKAKAKP